jgi:hypothetical protein
MKMSKEQLMAVARAYIIEVKSACRSMGVPAKASMGPARVPSHVTLHIGTSPLVAIATSLPKARNDQFSLYEVGADLERDFLIPLEIREYLNEWIEKIGFVYDRVDYKATHVYILPDHIVQQKFNSLISDQDTDAMISVF